MRKRRKAAWLLGIWGHAVQRGPQRARVADDPGRGDAPVGDGEERGARVLHAAPGGGDAAERTQMRPAPGHAGDRPGLEVEELLDLVVPVGEGGADGPHVGLEGVAADDLVQGAAEDEVLGEDLVGDVDALLVPQLVVEAADEGSGGGGHGAAGCHAREDAGVDEDVDRLYGLPLEEFVAERDALAKRLRADKRREEADAVKSLRKPSVAAWAVNQVLRCHPEDRRALL